MSPRALLGAALITAGLILLAFFRDSELGWFQGGSLGPLLGLVGAIDLVEDRVRARRRRSSAHAQAAED